MIAKFLFVLLIVQSVFSFSQKPDLSNDATVQLIVINPTDNVLTVLMKNKQIKDGLKPVRTISIGAHDTTYFPFEIVLAENRVPQNDYDFRVYESPDYYNITYHSNWFCNRVNEGVEYYTCQHTVYEAIVLVDSLQFDSLSFFQELLMNSPIYESTELDSLPKPTNGETTMISDAINLLKTRNPNENVAVFLALTVEVDGTVSTVEVVKSSNQRYNQELTEYFSELYFKPGYRNKLKVRSRLVVPVKLKLN